MCSDESNSGITQTQIYYVLLTTLWRFVGMRNPEKFASRRQEGFCLCCFQSANSGPDQLYISEDMSAILQTLSRGTGAQTSWH